MADHNKAMRQSASDEGGAEPWLALPGGRSFTLAQLEGIREYSSWRPAPFGVKVRHIDLKPPAEFFHNGERYRRKNNGQSVKLSDETWWRFDFDFMVTPANGVTASQGQAIGADTPMGKPE